VRILYKAGSDLTRSRHPRRGDFLILNCFFSSESVRFRYSCAALVLPSSAEAGVIGGHALLSSRLPRFALVEDLCSGLESLRSAALGDIRELFRTKRARFLFSTFVRRASVFPFLPVALRLRFGRSRCLRQNFLASSASASFNSLSCSAYPSPAFRAPRTRHLFLEAGPKSPRTRSASRRSPDQPWPSTTRL